MEATLEAKLAGPDRRATRLKWPQVLEQWISPESPPPQPCPSRPQPRRGAFCGDLGSKPSPRIPQAMPAATRGSGAARDGKAPLRGAASISPSPVSPAQPRLHVPPPQAVSEPTPTEPRSYAGPGPSPPPVCPGVTAGAGTQGQSCQGRTQIPLLKAWRGFSSPGATSGTHRRCTHHHPHSHGRPRWGTPAAAGALLSCFSGFDGVVTALAQRRNSEPEAPGSSVSYCWQFISINWLGSGWWIPLPATGARRRRSLLSLGSLCHQAVIARSNSPQPPPPRNLQRQLLFSSSHNHREIIIIIKLNSNEGSSAPAEFNWWSLQFGI